MNQPSLSGVRLKLSRADKYLDQLRAYRIERAGIHERRIIGEYEAASREYVFRAVGHLPPLDAGVDVGVLAHLLRSSLDNMLWQLILVRGGKPRIDFGPKGSNLRPTQFPIYEKRTEFERKAEAETKGILPPDFTVIEAAQPFHAGKLAKWHPLAMLGYLNNVDKHRFVHPAIAAGEIQRTILRKPVGRPYLVNADGMARIVADRIGQPTTLTGVVAPYKPDGSVLGYEGWSLGGNGDDPTEIARVRGVIVAPGRQPKMQMQPRPTLDISFSDVERPMTIHDLDDIRAEVVRLVSAFEDAFPADRAR